jgi:hypothetical protein
VGAEEVVTIDSSIKIGEAVEIIEGPFRGLEVVVTRLLPAKERVRVLFEFLGDPSKWRFRQQKSLPAKGLNRAIGSNGLGHSALWAVLLAEKELRSGEPATRLRTLRRGRQVGGQTGTC